MKDLRRKAHPHIDQRRASRHGSSRHGAPKATVAREYIGTHRKSVPVSLALSRRSAAQLAARAPVTARRGVIKGAGVGSLHIVRKKSLADSGIFSCGWDVLPNGRGCELTKTA